MSRVAAAHFDALQHAVQPRGALCRWTALHLASQSGTTELAAALLLMRADVNSKTSSGYPLRSRAAVPRASRREHVAQHPSGLLRRCAAHLRRAQCGTGAAAAPRCTTLRRAATRRP
jgi:hypothetical protein